MAVLFQSCGPPCETCEEAQPSAWSAVGAQETSVSADRVASGVSGLGTGMPIGSYPLPPCPEPGAICSATPRTRAVGVSIVHWTVLPGTRSPVGPLVNY